MIDIKVKIQNDLSEVLYNLEDLIQIPSKYRQAFFMRNDEIPINEYFKTAESDLITLINHMSPSFLAPAYHYNLYRVAHEIVSKWDDLKFEMPIDDRIDISVQRVGMQIELQAIYISIKTALDRLIPIFSYFYKGIQPHTTFGRIKNNDSGKGFMGHVLKNKSECELLEYIYKEYNEWIQIAVSPRDTIMHYNDLSIHFSLKSIKENEPHFIEIPSFSSERFLNGDIESNIFTEDITKLICDNWYSFFKVVMEKLKSKELIIERARF